MAIIPVALSTVSLFDRFEIYLGSETEVLFAQGCRIAHNDTNDSYANWRYVNEVEYATVEDNRQLIEEAKKVASQADLVILAIGENVLLNREAWGGNHVGDRSTLDLTASQQELSQAFLGLGKPVVAFLNNSKPITLGGLGKRFSAILSAHYAGQEPEAPRRKFFSGKPTLRANSL